MKADSSKTLPDICLVLLPKGMIWYCCQYSPSLPPHHVPDVVGQPVDDGVATTDKLQVFGFGGLLGHEEDYKAGRHEGHRDDDEDGDHHVSALQTGGHDDDD